MPNRIDSKTRDELLEEIRRALEDGRLSPADLAGVLRGSARAPRATRVTEVLGAAVVVLGTALAYATVFGDLPDPAQLLTPFAFPAVILGALAAMTRGERPRWELELTAGLGVVALAVALAASWAGAGDVAIDRWGVGAALVGGALCALLLMREPRPVAAGVGLTGAAVAAANFTASVLGMEGAARFRWLELALAVGAAAVGAALLRRGARTWAGVPLATATLLAATACMLSISLNEDLPDGLTAWHVLLSLTVAAAVVLATALRMPAVMAAGAAAGIMWLMLVIPVAGSSPLWALAVVAMGLVLVGAGVVSARLQRRASR